MRCLFTVACIQVIWGAPAVAQVYHEGLLLAQVRVEARHRNSSQDQTVCQAGPEQFSHKVFLHSLPKCATTSTGLALHQLGYADCAYDEDLLDNHGDAIEAASNLVLGLRPAKVPQSIQEQVRSILADFKNDMDRCQSFSDWPVGHASWSFPLALKYALWPEGRYIWIDRPFASWYESLWKHEEAHPEIFHGRHTPKDQAHTDYVSLRGQFIKFSQDVPGKALFLDMENVGWNSIKDFLFGDTCKAPDLPFPEKNVRSSAYVPDGQNHPWKAIKGVHKETAVEESDILVNDVIHQRDDFHKDHLAVFEQLKGGR